MASEPGSGTLCGDQFSLDELFRSGRSQAACLNCLEIDMEAPTQAEFTANSDALEHEIGNIRT